MRRSEKPLRRSQPLRPRSQKKQNVYRGGREHEGRRALVERLLAERPLCEAGARIFEHTDGKYGCNRSSRSHDVHEILRRSAGGSLTDERNLLCVCRFCHNWLHTHPKAAMLLGLLMSRYKGET